MQAPASPANESSRLAALRRLNLLDSPEDERFDRITRLARRIFDVSIALVTLMDPRFFDNPLVNGPPHIRFYAGHPIKSPDGFNIGTLRLIDSSSRPFTEDDAQTLQDMAHWVEYEIAQTGSAGKGINASDMLGG